MCCGCVILFDFFQDYPSRVHAVLFPSCRLSFFSIARPFLTLIFPSTILFSFSPFLSLRQVGFDSSNIVVVTSPVLLCLYAQHLYCNGLLFLQELYVFDSVKKGLS